MTQYVNCPTQICGNTLDWVIAPESDSILQSVQAIDKQVSDHHFILCTTKLDKKPPLKINVTSRNLKSIDIKQFRSDIRDKFLTLTDSDIDCEKFDSLCKQVLDGHAPLKNRTVKERTVSPWFSLEHKKLKQEKRRAERKWRKSGLPVHKEIYLYFKNKVASLCGRAKIMYFNSKFECVKNCKEMYQITKELFGQNQQQVFPTTHPISELPHLFSQFFHKKVVDIRNRLQQTSSPNQNDRVFQGIPLADFREVSEEEVTKIILNSPSKSCELDALPTHLLKDLLPDVVPFITKIINQSLSSGIVPQSFKEAIVNPLLKKSDLDQNVLNNYRPVSNLSFLSKILEKVVFKQLMEHLIKNNLREKFQSAYRMFHSTETALLRVFNDLLNALDSGNLCILTLLDLSAAFDTIDHDILLSRLGTSFGISGSVHRWIKSYLSNRTNRVKVLENYSSTTVLEFGVPQGSVLGPILFTLYTEPLADIIKLFKFMYHFYADDSQSYKSVSLSNLLIEIHRIEECINYLQNWMNDNMLMLNMSKTEFMILGKASTLKKIQNIDMNLNDCVITPTDNVKNLGVLFDNELTMSDQVSSLCKNMFYGVKKISLYRRFMTQDVAEKLMVSLVLSKMDYCNCLLAGVPNYLIQKIQHIQNYAAKVIFRKKKYEHVTPLLKSLHWLPVKQRIKYKIIMLCHKILKTNEPAYLRELLIKPEYSRNTRSSDDETLLFVPRKKLITYGDRSFEYIGPSTWNNIPRNIREQTSTDTFKRDLKTYLFKEAYNT